MNRFARFLAGSLVLAFAQFAPSNLYAACTSPAAATGSMNWNSGTSVFQYCDGTNWQNFGGSTTFGAGTVSAPGWAVTGDTATGIWEPAANTLSTSAGGVEVLRLNTVTSGVDYFTMTPSATGTHSLTLAAAGSDTDVSIALTPKGGGVLYTAAPVQITGSTDNPLAVSTTSTSATALSVQASGATGSTYAGYFTNASNAGKAVYGYASSGSGTTYGGYFQNQSSTGTALMSVAGNAATLGLVVRGAASQTGDLAEFQNSSGTRLAIVDASGYIAEQASGYINFGSTTGTSGYGIFDNAGTLQYKNSGGTWTNFGGSTFAAGTVSAPGWAVTGNTTTGFYAPATNTLSAVAGGVEVERWNTIASGVDYLSITPSAAGTPGAVTIGAGGSDTDIGITISPKGAGGVGIATAPVSDYLLSLNGSSTSNNSQIINIVQADAAAENTSAITVNNTANAGTFLAGTRTMQNLGLTFTPSITVSEASSSTTTGEIDGFAQTIDFSNAALSATGTRAGRINGYGVKTTLTGTPAITASATTSTGHTDYTTYGEWVSNSVSPTWSGSGARPSSYTAVGGSFSASGTAPTGTNFSTSYGGVSGSANGGGAASVNSGVSGTANGPGGINYGVLSQAYNGATNYGLWVYASAAATNSYGIYIVAGGTTSTDYALYSAATAQSYLAGNLGIGSTTPAYPLDVVGDIRTSTCLRYASSTLGTCSSDRILKKNIAPYILGLDKVIALKPVTYLYNGLGGNPDDGRVQIGFIAQDVEKVAPELVGKQDVKLHPGDTKTTTIKTVNYGAISYILVNAVKELKHMIDGIIDDVKKLAARMDEAFTRLAAHDSAINSLQAKLVHDDDEIALLKKEIAGFKMAPTH